MGLLACHHSDPLSAAVLLAENRADKAQRLRREAAGAVHGDQLRKIANRSALRLFHDVREFIAYEYAQVAHGAQVPDNVCERLHAAVARARGEVTIVTACPPLLDRSYTGHYLRDRDDGGFVLEVDGQEVTFGSEYRDQLGR